MFPQRRWDFDRAGAERVEQAAEHAALCPSGAQRGVHKGRCIIEHSVELVK